MENRSCKFRVMSFNLRFGLAEDGKDGWDHRKDLVAALLEKHGATFIGVQESNHFQTSFLIDRLKGHGHIGWHNLSKKRWQSNLIFHDQSWRCVRHRHFFLSETPDVESRMKGSKWPRQCVIGLFEKDGCQVVVANTHFDFDAVVQQKSARLVCGFLSTFPAGCPAVITGDFNSNPDSPAWRYFSSQGFNDAFEGHHATTYHEFSGKETNRHIDWILHRGGLEVQGPKIITDNTAGRYPSDHYPLLSGFSRFTSPEQSPASNHRDH